MSKIEKGVRLNSSNNETAVVDSQIFSDRMHTVDIQNQMTDNAFILDGERANSGSNPEIIIEDEDGKQAKDDQKTPTFSGSEAMNERVKVENPDAAWGDSTSEHSTDRKAEERRKEARRSTSRRGALRSLDSDMRTFQASRDTSIRRQLLNLWGKFLFRPDSLYKIKWDMLVILLSIWNSIEIPYQFAFSQESRDKAIHQHESHWVSIMEVIIDCLFGFDIIVNFRSMYIDPKTDELISDPKLIS